MKSLSLMKVPILLVGLGAVLLFAPACKAQEVSPDHFDGTDPWEAAARRPVAAKAKPTPATGSYQAQNKKSGTGASLQLASERDPLNSTLHNTVAVQDKRKPALRKSNKQ